MSLIRTNDGMRSIIQLAHHSGWTTADQRNAEAVGQAIAMRGIAKKLLAKAVSHQANVWKAPQRFRHRWIEECTKSYKQTRRLMLASADAGGGE